MDPTDKLVLLFSIIIPTIITAAGFYLNRKKPKAEVSELDSKALKNSTEVNELLTKQVLSLQTRVEAVEHANRGPFRLTVEFSTGEWPIVHKTELVMLPDGAIVGAKPNVG